MAVSPGCRYCDVVIPHARLDELTYACGTADPPPAPGDCVEVRVRGGRRRAVVVRMRDDCPVSRVLPVDRVVERGLVGPGLLELTDWVAGYYSGHRGEALGAALPRGICGYRPRKDEEEPAASRPGPGSSPPPVEYGRFGAWFSGRDSGREELVRGFVAGALDRGQALVLVPEHELARWRQVLAGLAVLVEYHSGLAMSARKRAWRRLRKGAGSVVLGVRSAVLAPLEPLDGIVVVDEHQDVFKEERHPRFNARDVAVVRAQRAGCPVLLLSRTPSLETFRNVAAGVYHELDPLPGPSARPGTMVVDLRRHRDEVLSPLLARQLEAAARDGVALLYVNRHGISRNVCCRECGAVVECPECRVPEVLQADRSLVCGSCGVRRPAPEVCPACGGAVFRFRAPGIELVARAVEERLGPGARVERLAGGADLDLAGMESGVVVGTRTLLFRDWPSTTRLVGVVNFDYDLALPDFRARERAFQGLAEIERRCRRLGARLLVQTWRPEEPALGAALALDATGFCRAELERREAMAMPPFRRLAVVEATGGGEGAVRSRLERLARRLAREPGIEALGPAPAPAVRGRHRWRLLVSCPRNRRPGPVFGRLVESDRRVEVRVDVDPVSLF